MYRPSDWLLMWPTCEHPQILEANNSTLRRNRCGWNRWNLSFYWISFLRTQLARTTRFRSAQFIATSMWCGAWSEVMRRGSKGGGWVVGCLGGWRNLMHILEEFYMWIKPKTTILWKWLFVADHVTRYLSKIANFLPTLDAGWSPL